MAKDNIAIITARGGSKRVPRKNIKSFCGKPIITYSIDAALSSGVFDEVMVSTDDEEIKEISLAYGADVPFMRSEKTSGDYAMTHEVLIEVLDEYKKMGRFFKNMCCIYPTAPFISGIRLKMAMDILECKKADSVLPVVPFSYPPQRGLILREDGIKFQYIENEFVRTQDLETIYHDAGQFYCVNVDSFLKSKRLIMTNAQPIILNELEVQDIDSETDWKIAELKYKLVNLE